MYVPDPAGRDSASFSNSPPEIDAFSPLTAFSDSRRSLGDTPEACELRGLSGGGLFFKTSFLSQRRVDKLMYFLAMWKRALCTLCGSLDTKKNCDLDI